MEHTFQLNTWQGLFLVLLLLITLYWLFKFVAYALEQFAKRNITTKKILVGLKKIIRFFKLGALVIMILDFVAINYITHTIVLVVIGVFGYTHVLNYIHGVFLKNNTLIREGAIIQIGDFKGEIKKFLTFGMVLSIVNGERFMTYSVIDKLGFYIKNDDTSLLRQTLFIKTELSEDKILDLLFDNPILNYEETPSLKKTETSWLKLKYTLEPGATTKALISFVEDKNITTSLTNNTVL